LKTIRYLLLGVFIVFIATSEVKSEQKNIDSGSKNQNTPVDAKANSKNDTQTATHTVVIYYFYQEPRCVTCKTLEQYTGEAVQMGFPTELKSGKLLWMPVDVKKDGNWHFVEDFQLRSKSVVAAVYKGGKLEKANMVEWKNLDQIWQLVRIKPDFLKYIQDETRTLLDKYKDKSQEKPKDTKPKKKKNKKK
jgi:hypothetical protein